LSEHTFVLLARFSIIFLLKIQPEIRKKIQKRRYRKRELPEKAPRKTKYYLYFMVHYSFFNHEILEKNT